MPGASPAAKAATVLGSTEQGARPRLAEEERALLRRCDAPWFSAIVAGAAALAVVLARLSVAARGNIGSFVIAGNTYANPRLVPRGVPVGAGNGYDGQFYYRMALDPLDFARRAFGIRLDTLSRLERIGYPALSWLAAAGHAAAVPAALVAVNVLALALLGLAGGLLAHQSGRHAAWGLVLPGYWGYQWTLARDLTEIVAAAFLVLGLVAIRAERWWLAAGALSVGVLTKETVVIPVAVFGILRLAEILGLGGAGGRRGFGAKDAPWVVSGVVFVTWQAVVASSTGKLPLLDASGHNLGIPFQGLVSALGHYLGELPATAAALWCGELALLGLLSIAAASTWRASTAERHERFAWLAFVVLIVCLASGIWRGAVGFRSLDDIYLFGCIIFFFGTRSMHRAANVLAGLVSIAWLVVAVELVLFR